MSAHTISQLATWMIEHPCIDSEVLEGRGDDSGHSSGSEIALSRAQVIHLYLILQIFKFCTVASHSVTKLFPLISIPPFLFSFIAFLPYISNIFLNFILLFSSFAFCWTSVTYFQLYCYV